MNGTKELINALTAMFKIFGQEPADDVFKIYVGLLEEYPIADVKAAIRRAVSESEFKPVPATILKHLRPSKGDFQIQALKAAERFDRAVANSEPSYLGDDKILRYLVHHGFNLHRHGQMNDEEFEWAKRNLQKAYVDVCLSPPAMTDVENFFLPAGERKSGSLSDVFTKYLEQGDGEE